MTPEELHESNYGAIYQIVGALAGEAGLFGTAEVDRLLTDLNAMAGGAQIDLCEAHLPFAPKVPE